MSLRTLLIFILLILTMYAHAIEIPIYGCKSTSTNLNKHSEPIIKKLYGKVIDADEKYVIEYECRNGSKVLIAAFFYKTPDEAKVVFDATEQKFSSEISANKRLWYGEKSNGISYVKHNGLANFYFVKGNESYLMMIKGGGEQKIFDSFFSKIRGAGGKLPFI